MDYVKYIRDRVGHDPINLTGVNVLIINENNEVLLQKRDFSFWMGLIGGITDLGSLWRKQQLERPKKRPI